MDLLEAGPSLSQHNPLQDAAIVPACRDQVSVCRQERHLCAYACMSARAHAHMLLLCATHGCALTHTCVTCAECPNARLPSAFFSTCSLLCENARKRHLHLHVSACCTCCAPGSCILAPRRTRRPSPADCANAHPCIQAMQCRAVPCRDVLSCIVPLHSAPCINMSSRAAVHGHTRTYSCESDTLH